MMELCVSFAHALEKNGKFMRHSCNSRNYKTDQRKCGIQTKMGKFNRKERCSRKDQQNQKPNL